MIPLCWAVDGLSKFEKLYNKIASNPKNVDFESLNKLLLRYGFKCKKPKSGTSHYNYYHEKLPDILTIPFDRPVKSVYVKKAIAAIERLKEN